MRTAKTLIRLGGCAQSLCLFCHVAAHFHYLCHFGIAIAVSFPLANFRNNAFDGLGANMGSRMLSESMSFNVLFSKDLPMLNDQS